jgi:hypothetical protein
MAEMDAFDRGLESAFLRLVDEVPSEVDGIAVAHRVAREHPRGRVRGFRWAPAAVPRLAWLLLLVGLLLAISAGALLVGSGLLERAPWLAHDPSPLMASGIEVISPDAGSYNRVIADGDGNLWAADSGVLVRYTPATGAARTWTVGDDLRFGSGGISDITPARAGGVWLIGTRSLQRFDGTAFRESVDVGADVTAAVEAPDRSLWAATSDGLVIHVVGATRSQINVPAPSARVVSIAADDAGRVWCGLAVESDGNPAWASMNGWVSRFDGTGWARFDAGTATPLGGSAWAIAMLPGGSVVVATTEGVARFDGSSWTNLTAGAPAPAGPTSVAVAPDGSLWTAGASPADGVTTVGHLSEGSWTLFGPADGLPGAGPEAIPLSTVATTDGVFVGTRSGIYELEYGRWNRAWPATAAPAPEYLDHVAAASRDEAWAWSWGEVWRVGAGSWTAQPAPDTRAVDDALVSADGTPWMTVYDTGGGPGPAFRLQGDQWLQMAPAPSVLGMNPDRTEVWVASPDGTSAGTVVRSLAFDGRAWSEVSSTGSTALVTGCLHGAAIGGDGSAWLGSSGRCMYQDGKAGLARYRDGSWELVRPPGATAGFAIDDLTAASDGSVWALGRDPDTTAGASGSGTVEPRTWVARFDGTAWTVFDASDGLSQVYSIAAAPDGSVWATTSSGLARFDGTAWTTVVRGLSFYDVDVAPDGTVWITGSFGVARLSPTLTGQ